MSGITWEELRAQHAAQLRWARGTYDRVRVRDGFDSAEQAEEFHRWCQEDIKNLLKEQEEEWEAEMPRFLLEAEEERKRVRREWALDKIERMKCAPQHPVKARRY